MEDKTKNLKQAKKIKANKNMTSGAEESNIKKKSKNEGKNKEKYHTTHNNIQKITVTSDTRHQKPLAKEKDLLQQRTKNKSKSKSREKKKEKDSYTSKNNTMKKKKDLTTLNKQNKKKAHPEHQTNQAVPKDDSLDKKNKLYENQREPNFLNK